MDTVIKNNAKTIRAWYMYDWANSVYSLVITSTIFPIYFTATTREAGGGSDMVPFLGLKISNSVLFSYSISLAFLLVGICNPILTAIADYSGKKKAFMQFFCYLGSLCCALLFFFTPNTVELGVFAFILATIGFTGSLVFYNAFLPEIATPDRFDAISARGFAFGYVGSVVLLILNLLPILQPAWFGGISAGLASRIAFLCTGLWWAGFAQITFRAMPNNPYGKMPGGSLILNGYLELAKVWEEVKKIREMKKFLFSFFFYNMGVQTVMYMATIFGEKELKLPSSALITTILLLQIVAVGGSVAFSKLSERFGNKAALASLVIIWILVCAGAWFVYTEYEFYALAAVVGCIMGGIQSLSRSTYAKLIPAHTTDHAAFFSFYDVTDKAAIVLGTFSYGLIEAISGNMRTSILALATFFIVGLVMLFRLEKVGVLMPQSKNLN